MKYIVVGCWVRCIVGPAGSDVKGLVVCYVCADIYL